MTTRPKWLVAAIVVCSLLQLAGMAVFARGFFPYKKVLPGLAAQTTGEDYSAFGLVPAHSPPNLFDRLIFIVIDALRSDFMFSTDSSMYFVHRYSSGQFGYILTGVLSKITSGFAYPFTAHALPPTVTLPRIKALTTGSIPNFLDAILNIAESDTSSTLAYQDTWLSQANASGKRIVMYGDDTWIKLFPGMFSRTEGTSSFFVSDFTEVDGNVTRHLDEELTARDWDVLILHYLGLDHIGHLGGPRSMYMKPKQIEMDGILEKIYNSLTTKKGERTLMVVCGDHGMNDAGNHGGSSSGETSTAVLFMSPSFSGQAPNLLSPIPHQNEFDYYTKIQQSDLVPTISSLLGWTLPRNNIGVLLQSFLALWKEDPRDRLSVIGNGIVQLAKLVRLSKPEIFASGFIPDCSQNDNIGCVWSRCKQTWNEKSNQNEAIDECFEFLLASQSLLSSASTDYRVSYMYLGLVVLFLGVVGLSAFSAQSLIPSRARNEVVLVALGFGMLMFASSYVEEEQQFWYWATATHFTYSFLKSLRSKETSPIQSLTIFVQLPLLRIIRRWNQTGQKFAGAPDIVKDFLQPNPSILAILVQATYCLAGYTLYRDAFPQDDLVRRHVWPTILAGVCFIFKVSMASEAGETLPFWLQHIPSTLSFAGSLVAKARISFLLLAVGLFSYSIQWVRSPARKAWIHGSFPFLNLFLLGQMRYVNIPLFALFEAQRWALQKSEADRHWLALSALFLQHVSFFALGNSNSLSSIDLSNAYNGIASYSIPLVGALTFVSNWAGPIWWIAATFAFLSNERNTPSQGAQGSGPGHSVFAGWLWATSLLHGIVIVFLVGSCIILRTHLFIWTVFSPKFLFQAVWLALAHILVEGVFGGLICVIG